MPQPLHAVTGGGLQSELRDTRSVYENYADVLGAVLMIILPLSSQSFLRLILDQIGRSDCLLVSAISASN